MNQRIFLWLMRRSYDRGGYDRGPCSGSDVLGGGQAGCQGHGQVRRVECQFQTARSDAASSKTPWGDPDLQGTWTSDDTWGVPFERPKNFGTRATLTEDELKDRQKSVQQSEEFVDTGGANAHSPGRGRVAGERKGRSRARASAGTLRPRSGCRAGSGTLGRVRAPTLASDFADCGSARWPASSLDARGAGQAGRQERKCGANRFRHPIRTGATMTAASRAAWPGPFFP